MKYSTYPYKSNSSHNARKHGFYGYCTAYQVSKMGVYHKCASNTIFFVFSVIAEQDFIFFLCYIVLEYKSAFATPKFREFDS